MINNQLNNSLKHSGFQKQKQFFILLLLFLLPLVNFSCRSIREKETGTWVTVKIVIDGDTFWADDGTPEILKVRLTGIDAPETRKSQRKDIGYYGKESKEYLRQLIAGKRVRLEYDVEKYDQYRRTLAYVFLEDGTFVNAELIKGGYAMTLTIPPNVKYADQFFRLQRKARRENMGLWGNNKY